MKLSVIIPVLNEAASLPATLMPLQALRQRQHEIILVDGGSSDDSTTVAQALVDRVIESSPGRATQMNNGARHARGDVLWFLHADTRAPDTADELIEQALSRKDKRWGRFQVRLSGSHPLFRLIEFMMNLRSRISGIATGDQGIFVRRDSFEKLGGFDNIALMEDIAISKRLKRHYGHPARVTTRLITSSRRWEKQGIISTVILMWRLRLAYFLGRHPDNLKQSYSDN